MTETAALDPDRYARHWVEPRGFLQFYVREGEGGQPLVLLHGWPETSRIWWRNVGELARRGFDVVAPDLRGFGESEMPADGLGDPAAHSADLYALLRGELGFERVTLVGGDFGGVVAQDLALRFPGFVERLVLFNTIVPYLRDAMAGLRTRGPLLAADFFARQGNDGDALAAELPEPLQRRRYVASFYGWRFWAHPGAFGPAELEFHTQPFADGDRLRTSFSVQEAALHPRRRSAPPLFGPNPTETLVLHGPSDRVIAPDFAAMAERVFPNRIGPFVVDGAGHFLQWEAAPVLNGAIAHLCRSAGPRPGDTVAYVGLGSNLGERERHLCAGFAALRAHPAVRGVVASRVYETAPIGPGEQGPYLNAAARLHTSLAPRALLELLLEIERSEGRERSGVRDEPRTLDLDLLLYADRRIDQPGHVVPHPRLAERPFALEPLRDLAPDLVWPGAAASVAALADAVRDPAAVRVREN